MPKKTRSDPETEALRPVILPVRFPRALHAELSAYAAENYRSRSGVVIAAVARYLRKEREA